MAGLLDMFGSSWEDPKTAAILSLGQGLLSQRGMPGLLSGAQGYVGTMAQASEAARRKKLEEEQRAQIAEERALRMEQLREAMQAQRSGRAQEQTDTGLLRTMMQPQAGPTQDGSPMPRTSFDPSAFLAQGGSLPGVQNALQLNAALNPERKRDIRPGDKPQIEILPDGSVRKLYEPEPEAPKQPSAVQEYEFARQQGYPGSFLDFQLAQRKAGATSVSVNTGQKGFDNTLKLRSDFRSEPIYKAHQEVQSAHSQITAGLKQQSPAGDLAGATKMMKILDPTSVVRESELGMAMAATGVLDRVQNYTDMILKGTKLTPSQRADFQRLSDQLLAESAKHYNAKRSEYEGIAKRNELPVADVLGDKAPERATAGPRTVVRTGTRNGKRVVQYSDGTIEEVSGYSGSY